MHHPSTCSPANHKTKRNRTFEKTFAYAKRFGGLSNQAVTGQLRELCSARGLMDFETAAVTNLQPQSMDEAKTLVPSLEVGERGGEQVLA